MLRQAPASEVAKTKTRHASTRMAPGVCANVVPSTWQGEGPLTLVIRPASDPTPQPKVTALETKTPAGRDKPTLEGTRTWRDDRLQAAAHRLACRTGAPGELATKGSKV